MRVGVISIYHESNTFMPRPTTLDDFRRGWLLRGAAIPEQFKWEHHEIFGFFNGLDSVGIEIVPIFLAWATPGGAIEAETFRQLLDMMMQELAAAGKLDGVLVAPHGAGVSEDIRDMDGHWLTLLRAHLGPEIPIIGTLDPHANLSQKMVDACDALTAYRTNPHLDQHARGLEAASLMARTLRGEIKPVQAAALPAMAINIERQLTSELSCAVLYKKAKSMLKIPGVLSNSVMLGFPYADVEEMGSGFIVVTNGNRSKAQHLADEMGETLWKNRTIFAGELIGIEQALDLAEAARAPVCLLDMGDNVGGGSPGDSTFLAHALNARKWKSFVCLYDPESVKQATAVGQNGRVRLRMGGKTDGLHGTPVESEVTVRNLHDGKFVEEEVRHGGMKNFDMGSTAIVETDTGLTVQLTSQRVFPVSIAQLKSCGLDPSKFRAIVAKGVHAPVTAYAKVCGTMIRVNTPGATTADMVKLNYKHRRRPLYPFENVG